MDGYQQAEQRGRNKTSQRFGQRLQIVYTVDRHNPIDFYATGITLEYSGVTYVVEIKNYDDPEHPRPFTKFSNYMIDWSKLSTLKAEAKGKGRRPLLIVYFDDWTIIWDITDIDIDSRREWRYVNKDGQNYGKKEWTYVTYLYQEDILWQELRTTTERKMKLLS